MSWLAMTASSNALRLCLGLLLLWSTRPDAAAEATLFPAALQRGKAATVLVDLGREGSASAFLVHACGLFCTARHVVESLPNGATLKLIVHSGDTGQKTLSAHVVAVFEEADLALVKTDEPIGIEPLPLAGETGLAELVPVVEFGYPFGKMLAGANNPNPAISVNAGHISALRRDGQQLESIQLDAATNPGNSGGPVLNLNGEVVGVLSSGFGENLNFAVPIARVAAALQQPIVSLRTPAIGYRQRGELHRFEIETLPTAPFPPDGEIALSLRDRGNPPRTFKAVRQGEGWSVVASPCLPEDAARPLRLRVEAAFKGMVVATSTDDSPVRVGDRQLLLSDLRSFENSEVPGKGKLERRRQTTLAHFDRERGTFATIPELPKGLPRLLSALNAIELTPLAATRFTVGAYHRGPVRMPYDLTLSVHGQPLANSHGILLFTDAPAGLKSDSRDDEDEDPSSQTVIISSRGSDDDSLRLDRLLDPGQDARQGTWVRKYDTVETVAEPGAWCELPVLPSGNYTLHAVIAPSEAKRGELLLLLPVGPRQALLHFDGARGRAMLDLTAQGLGSGDSSVAMAPFEANRDFEVNVSIATDGELVRIAATLGKGHPLLWVGRTSQLAAPKDVPAQPGRLALGHHDLAMSLESLRVRTEGGDLELLRELPDSVESASEDLVASFPFDRPTRSEVVPPEFPEGIGGRLYGKTGIVPGAVGGALKLEANRPGTFRVDLHQAINSGWHEDRSHSFWFNADPDPKNLDHCRILLDDGGIDKGLVIYLQDGTLFAGGWFAAQKWNTWLEAPGIQPGQWYHVALVLDGETKIRSEAFRLYLNGAKIASGLGKMLGPHEQTCYGGVFYSTRTREGKPKQEFTEARRFIGLLDEAQIYSGHLSDQDIKILAGGTFHFEVPRKP